MQTPRGHTLVDGRFYPEDLFAVIFTPSFPYRLTHTVIAFTVTNSDALRPICDQTTRAVRVERV